MLLDKQFKSSIVEMCFSPNNIWSLRICKLLKLNLQLMRHKSSDKEFNNTVSLRVLEVFTKFDDIEKTLLPKGMGQAQLIVAQFKVRFIF